MAQKQKYTWLLGALFLVFVVLGILGTHARVASSIVEAQLSCPECNVILISIDTLGAKHTSLHDASLNTTPFLASFAQERAVLFEEAFTASGWTLPSHASMLTGEYPWDVDVWFADDMLPDRAYTIAEALQETGYYTTAFSVGVFVQPEWQFDQGFNEFHGETGNEADWQDLPQLTEDAYAWVESYRGSDPYFLFIRPFHPHDPYGDPEDPESIRLTDIVTENTQVGGPTNENTIRFQEAYQKEVREMDAAFESFFTALDAGGYLDNTVIIFTADHGEEFGEHGTVGSHAHSLYREVLHVPLFISTPHSSAKRVTSSVEIRSIPKTILELIGVDAQEIGGHSLLPYMSGATSEHMRVESRTAVDRSLFFEISALGYEAALDALTLGERTEPFTDFFQRSLIEGEWHILETAPGVIEVYNMYADPNETENIIHDAPQNLSL